MRISIKAGRKRLLAATAGVLLAGSAVAAVAMSPAKAALPDPITITPIANQSTTPIGSEVDLGVAAADTDPKGGLLVYSATGLPAGLTINGATGEIAGIATTAAAGADVTVFVTDHDKNQATTSFTWTVKDLITVEPIANQATALDVHLAGATALPVTAGDNNALAPLKYVATGLPNGLVINNATGSITGETLKSGAFDVTVTVTDGTASPAGTAAFTWTVGNTITVKAPATEKSSVGTKIALVTISSTDSDAALKTFTYAATNLPAGLAISAAGVISGTPTTDATYATVITATDAEGSVGAATIQWTVGKQKTVVKLTAPAARTVYLGVKASIALKATDSDPAFKVFSYSSSALPRGLSLNKATGVISGRPAAAGTKKTTLSVTDANGAVGTAVITFRIRGAVAVVDLEPAVKSTVVGTGLNIQFTATDAVAHDKMSFSATGLPPGMHLSAKPLMLWGWPTKAGRYTALVHEKGALGSSAVTKVPLKVGAASAKGPRGQIRLSFDGKCLQAPKGAKVQIANCVSGATESWTLATDGTIRAKGACLDISGSSTYKGKGVQLLHCSSSVREQWRQASKGLLVNPASGLCLADPGTSKKNGTVPVLGGCGVKAAEQWKLPAQPMLAAEGGMCADDFHSQATPGSKVDLFSCNGTNGQTWNFLPDGTIRQAQYATACLTVHGPLGQAGVKVTLYPCQGGNKEQHWTVGGAGGLASQVSLAGACLAIPSLKAESGVGLVTAKCSKSNPLALWHVQ